MPTPPDSRLDLPFFEPRHHDVVREVRAWLDAEHGIDSLVEGDYAQESRGFVRSLGRAGLLRHMFPTQDGGDVDVRTIALLREEICYRSALADSAFITQGIATAALWRHGNQAVRDKYVAGARDGSRIPAFGLSEPEGGSDVAATKTVARREGDAWVIDGTKTWTSNAGIADHYIVFARTGELPGARGLSAFMVDADNPGLTVLEPLVVSAPHPMASVRFANCRVKADMIVGEPTMGFQLAMSTLDIFRPTVGAAALGLAQRALDECVERVRTRVLYGAPMIAMPAVQARIAEMQADLHTARLAVYRACWLRDKVGREGGRAASAISSMGKLVGTEAAHRIIDSAVQLFGGKGVTRGCIIEQLWRDVRAFRIYEGATEVQRAILGRHVARSVGQFPLPAAH